MDLFYFFEISILCKPVIFSALVALDVAFMTSVAANDDKDDSRFSEIRDVGYVGKAQSRANSLPSVVEQCDQSYQELIASLNLEIIY